MTERFIIITDLDGTLLDSRTYTFEPAAEALRLTRERGVPVVFCSSKTRAEIDVYRQRTGNSHPFISENGGGIFIPRGYFPGLSEGEERNGFRVITLGTPYEKVREAFIGIREQLGVPVRGFGDMTVDEIAVLTGLTRDEARLAKQRDFDEPFVFEEGVNDRFLEEIEGAGFRWTQGQYFHMMGDHHKGRAVNMLRSFFEEQAGPVTLIGLGDSLNDLPFLLAVDKPVLIRKHDGSYDDRIAVPDLYRTAQAGPAGWNEAVLHLLSHD